MSPSIAASVSEEKKEIFRKKAEELGISQSELVRILCFKNLPDLVIGYRSHFAYSGSPIDIKRLKPPVAPKIITKEHISMKECINDLKIIFENGLDVLVKMDNMTDQEKEEYNKQVGIKTKEDLEEKSKEAEEKIYQKLEKQMEEAK